MDQCPASAVPFVSVSCSGSFCNMFHRPCSPLAPNDPVIGCGSDPALTCRTPWPGLTHSPTGGQLANWLQSVFAINNIQELVGFAGSTTAQQAILAAAQQLRAKVWQLWNMSQPSAEASGTQNSLTELTFCLPSESVAADISNRLRTDLGEVYASSDIATLSTVQACTSLGCDLNRVGNGVCHTECNNMACGWDGGDCGGPAISLGTAFGQFDSPANVDSTIPAGCLLTVADLQAVTTAPIPTTSMEFNFWEACNGIGQCIISVGGQAQCQCPSGCGSSGYQPVSASTAPTNNKCMYCVPQRAPCAYAPGGCSALVTLSQRTGLQDRLISWDGTLSDGTVATAPDRKSGYIYDTPPASFNFKDGSLQWNFRPIAQGTCSGEVGVTAINSNLQFAVHAPALQDVLAFLTNFTRQLQAARAPNLVGPGTPPLDPYQFETRFMPHHFAFWLYQYTSFDQPWLRSGNYPPFSNGFGPNNVSSGAIFTDFLSSPYARREPGMNFMPPPAMQLYDTDWAKGWRAYINDGCTLQAVLGGQNGANGRTCRFQFDGLKSLFTQGRGNNPVPGSPSPSGSPPLGDMSVTFDGRTDQCGGAPSYATSSLYPTAGVAQTLSAAQAADAMPAWSAALSGAVTALLAYPQICSVPLDCKPVKDFTPDCVDIDARLLGLSTIFFGRSSNPITEFVFGGYNTGLTCGANSDLRGTLRRFLRQLGGDTSYNDTGTSPSFCFYSPEPLSQNSLGWINQQHLPGTCANRPNVPYIPNQNPINQRVCIPSVSPSPTALNPPQGGSQPCNIANPNGRGCNGQSQPLTLTQLVGHGRDLYPPPAASGAAPQQANNYAFNNDGDASNILVSQNFVVSIPLYTTLTMTNSDRDMFRWALATAMSTRYGVPLVPDAVLVTAVVDNAQAFTPLPGTNNQRAGIQISFSIESPIAVAPLISAQLGSTAGGTMGGDAARVLSDLGVISFAAASQVSFKQIFPVPPPPPPLAGGIIFAIVIGLFFGFVLVSLTVHYLYLKPRGKHVPFVPPPAFWWGCGVGIVAAASSLVGRGGGAAAAKGGKGKGAVTSKQSAGAKPATGAPKTGKSATALETPGGGRVVANPLAAAPAKPAGGAAPAAAKGAVPPPPPPAATAATGPINVVVVANPLASMASDSGGGVGTGSIAAATPAGGGDHVVEGAAVAAPADAAVSAPVPEYAVALALGAAEGAGVGADPAFGGGEGDEGVSARAEFPPMPQQPASDDAAAVVSDDVTMAGGDAAPTAEAGAGEGGAPADAADHEPPHFAAAAAAPDVAVVAESWPERSPLSAVAVGGAAADNAGAAGDSMAQ